MWSTFAWTLSHTTFETFHKRGLFSGDSFFGLKNHLSLRLLWVFLKRSGAQYLQCHFSEKYDAKWDSPINHALEKKYHLQWHPKLLFYALKQIIGKLFLGDGLQSQFYDGFLLAFTVIWPWRSYILFSVLSYTSIHEKTMFNNIWIFAIFVAICHIP